MSLQDTYAGGITFATPALSSGMYEGSAIGGGLHFDLPLATVAAFNQQALDFSSDASTARFGFFKSVADQVQAQQDKTGSAVLAQTATGQQSVIDMNTQFLSGFGIGNGSGGGLGALPPAPAIGSYGVTPVTPGVPGANVPAPILTGAPDFGGNSGFNPGGLMQYVRNFINGGSNNGAPNVGGANAGGIGNTPEPAGPAYDTSSFIPSSNYDWANALNSYGGMVGPDSSGGPSSGWSIDNGGF